MTNATQKTSKSSNARSGAAWPDRFGTMTKVAVKRGKKGRYAVITVDCKKFTETAFAFGDKLVDQIVAAGEGARVWFKGPIESVTRTNAAGNEYSEDQMKVVYFKNKSAEGAEGAATDEAATDQVVSDEAVEDEIPF